MRRGSSSNVENKSKMADGRHLEKLEKLLYLRIRLTDFDEIWHGDGSLISATRRPLTLMEFKSPRWRPVAILKNRNITMSS